MGRFRADIKPRPNAQDPGDDAGLPHAQIEIGVAVKSFTIA
jgi:hypothetical protein